MQKDQLLNNIHTVVSKNVLGDKALMARYKGFRGELFFENYIENNCSHHVLEGGLIFSKNSKESSLYNSIYITILEESELSDDYNLLYTMLSKLEFVKMYLVVYDKDAWKKVTIMRFQHSSIEMDIPKCKLYNFDNSTNQFQYLGNSLKPIKAFFQPLSVRGTNKYPILDSSKLWLFNELTRFSENLLLKVFMNRLVFDALIGFSVYKGKSSDIDLIVKNDDESFSLIEIKEKDLPKSKKGFGLDIPRIKDFHRIMKSTGLNYHLVVRHINNQKERKFLAWKYIQISDFIENVKNSQKVEGGTGMRSSSSYNPTLICDLKVFSNQPTF